MICWLWYIGKDTKTEVTFSGGTEITKVFFSREKSEQQETWVQISSIYCLWEWNEIKMSFVILLSYGFVRDCVCLMGKGEKMNITDS